MARPPRGSINFDDFISARRDTDDSLGPVDPTVATLESGKLSEGEITALVEEYVVALEWELAARENHERDWARWLKLYRSTPNVESKDYPIDHASNVVVPIAAIHSEAQFARIMQQVFATEPRWVAEELNRKYADVCKPLERWLDWLSGAVWNQRAIVKPWVQECVKLGTSVLWNCWSEEYPRYYDAATDSMVRSGRRCGPKPRWVPLEDVLVPGGYSNMQEAPYVAIRQWYDLTRLRQMEADGFFIDGSVDSFKSDPDDEPEIRKERRRYHEVEASREPAFGLFALWWFWFRRDIDGDGWPEEYTMAVHAGTKTLCRLVHNPYLTGMRPFVVGRFVEAEGDFYGIGIPEMVEQLQDEASTIHNQRRDNAHLSNIRMWITRTTSGIADETLRPRSGRVIKASDVGDLKELKLSDTRSVDAFEEQTVMQLAEKRTSTSDINLGRESSPLGRAAATTVMALLQEGAVRKDYSSADIKAALSEQAHQIIELYQTHGCPNPDEAGAPEQVLDTEPRSPGLPPDSVLVRALLDQQTDLRGMVSVKLNASTAAVNREVEKQSVIQLYQMVSQYLMQALQFLAAVNPATPPAVCEAIVRGVKGLDRMLDRVFQAFSVFDLDSVLVGDLFEQMQAQADQARQQMMMLQQQGMLPAGQPGQPQPGGTSQQTQPAPKQPTAQQQPVPPLGGLQ